jgi:tetratricopeptide (TPR) repeat protein
MIRYFALLIFLTGSLHLFAQTNPEAILRKEMDQAVELMDLGEYEAADTLYRHVLANMKVLPSELAFYFGKNSYYMANYKQSINWLNKYIELKGTSGTNYEEARNILFKAEQGFRLQENALALNDPEVNRRKARDCEEIGKVTCPVCKGQTVIIKKDHFGERFYTCPYSDEHGYLTCDEYQLLLEGKLKPKR